MKRKRYLIDDSSYPIFVTTTIINWIPIFQDASMASESLFLFEKLRADLFCKILAYVLMPNHFHAIIKSAEKGDLSILIQRWKSLTAKMILEHSTKLHPNWLHIFEESPKLHRREAIQKHQVWQPRFDDFAIRDEAQFQTKLNYIHGNPLKHGLAKECNDYPYSSIHDYLGGNNGFITIELWGPCQ
jgi:putative transposase